MNISVKKDSHGYIALVEGYEHIFSHGTTPEDAKKELLNVIEMMLDYHQEQIQMEKNIQKVLVSQI